MASNAPSPAADNAESRPHRRLRIAFLGWAQLSLQERQGTGYNLYASELAAGLAQHGHELFYLRSRLDYSIGRPLHVQHCEVWRGVCCDHLFNSPNLSPAASNFRNMRAEADSPAQTAAVLAWLDRVRAELVHVHSLEGFSLDLVGAIRASGRAVVVTPHNYWYLCPQVDLLHRESALCDDFEGGLRCPSCVACREPASARRRRALRQTLERVVGAGFVPAIRTRIAVLRARFRGAATVPAAPDAGPSDLFAGFTPHSDGVFEYGLGLLPGEEPAELGACPIDQNERFLAAKHHTRVENEYGARRRAGVAALNQASAILAPSDFLRRAHAAMGVEERRLRTVPYGAPHFDRLHRRAQGSPFYEMRPWDPHDARRPLRFAFHGTTRNNKGLLWLLRAIPLLDPDVRRRCQFVIRAAGWDWPFRKLASPYPEVQFTGGYDALQLLAAWGEYDVGILCHVWFDNLPLVMLEHLHGGKFVVSSRLGGPADWLDSRVTGLLYAAGHPEQLAQCITRLVRGDVTIASPREIHAAAPLPSFPAHVAQIEEIYLEALDRDGEPLAS